MPSSWIKNMTSWFQLKKDQSRLATPEKQNDLSAKPTSALSERVLEIMHKPDPNEVGPKRPYKP